MEQVFTEHIGIPELLDSGNLYISYDFVLKLVEKNLEYLSVYVFRHRYLIYNHFLWERLIFCNVDS